MKGEKICFRGMLFSVLFILLPILSFFLATILSFVFGCENVNEAGAPDCFGGELIYILFMMMWFIFFTFPIGLFALFLFFVVYIIIKLRK